MSVEIEPLELNFQRPFTVEVSRTLKIRNTSASPLVFKVKTTAPKQYCVRPNAGRIEPGQDFDVSVLLQAMKTDPPMDAKCKDKFLVQSARITPDKEFASIASVLDTTDKASIYERKIRVNWLATTDNADTHSINATPIKQSAINGANYSPDATRTFASPPGTADSASIRTPFAYSDAKDDDEPKSDTVRSTTSRLSTALDSTDDLHFKISQLEAELARYKDSGLRQRNAKASERDTRPASTAVVQREKEVAEGVPVQMTAILCLLSFLLAYFFF